MQLRCLLNYVSEEEATEDQPAGWYFAACYPGCLPESDWFGPYGSEEAAENAYKDIFEDND